MKNLFLLFLILVFKCGYAQQSKLWENFMQSKTNNSEPVLPDFSFAGYKYSEVPLPSFESMIFNVTDYGAIANDGLSDKIAIQKAIAAATANKEGIIFFPKGKYLINTAADDLSIIQIQSSKIVFRGEGDNENGSILFFEKDLPPADPTKMWTVPNAIKVSTSVQNEFLTKVVGNSRRESYSIEVQDASKIKKGDWVILKVENNSKELIAHDLSPLVPEKKWSTILNDGVLVNERHQISKVSGNTVEFVEPIHYSIQSNHGWELYSFAHLNHIGFEDLRFEGNYTVDFEHHRSARDDSGWSILKISETVDSWIRDCTFKNVSIPVVFSSASACTALNIVIEGKIGHSSVHASGGSTGILLANIQDKAGMHHSTGVGGGSTTGTVIWRSTYPSYSSFESHASQPRTTLFDNVEGGFFQGRAGGAIKNLPNHGRYLVLWNFKETDQAEENFRFVATDSPYWRIVPPIIVGFHGSGTTFKQDEVQVIESLGSPVKPESLFEAQLQFRLGKLPDWIVELKNENKN